MKTKNDKKIEYLEKHCALLEKENKQLKEEKNNLEMRISFSDNSTDKQSEYLKKLILDYTMAKYKNVKLYEELEQNKAILDKKIVELEEMKKVYKKDFDELLDTYTRFVKFN